jgi:superfamily II DNA/RNA helicase
MYNSNRPFAGRNRSSSGGNRQGNFRARRPMMTREQKNFQPSMFIKKAEEQKQDEAYQPQHVWADFAVADQIKRNIAARGYVTPTPIQDQIIPHLLQGKDVIGLAHTGTGKTAAFLIPLIDKISRDNRQKVLIIAPTRELAVQIQEEHRLFAAQMNQTSVLCIGGVNIKAQVDRVRRIHHFVIGTPGRIIDLEKRGVLRLSDYRSVVLDEVDQMFDMGFIHAMKYIIAKLPQERHSLFFSATMPDSIREISSAFLKDPVTVSLKTSSATSANVHQDVIKLNGRNKIDVLHDLLIKDDFKKVLLFGRTKHGMNKLEKILIDRGFKTAAIHGNKSQAQRQKALDMFKQNRIQILLATDVASRGLDIDNVSHVINYDLPQSYEDYVHRIGRTGRANKTGFALTFMD